MTDPLVRGSKNIYKNRVREGINLMETIKAIETELGQIYGRDAILISP